MPALPVTLAVDPALVEELTVMAAGPYAVDGVAGRRAAAPTRPRPSSTGCGRVAAVHPVVALPYGDVDADALDAAGLSGVVTRSLPGQPRGHRPGPAAPRDGEPAPTPAGRRHDQPAARPIRRAPATRRRGAASSPTPCDVAAAHRPRLGRGRDPAARDPADPAGRRRATGSSSAAPGSPTARRRSGCPAAARTGPHAR